MSLTIHFTFRQKNRVDKQLFGAGRAVVRAVCRVAKLAWLGRTTRTGDFRIEYTHRYCWEDSRQSMLQQHHHAFTMEEGERGETWLIQFSINAGDAQSIRQSPSRVPLAWHDKLQPCCKLESLNHPSVCGQSCGGSEEERWLIAILLCLLVIECCNQARRIPRAKDERPPRPIREVPFHFQSRLYIRLLTD